MNYNEDYDKKEYIATIIFGVIGTLLSAIECISSKNFITAALIFLIFAFLIIIIICLVAIKKYIRIHNFINYIFFEDTFNQFTYLPKLLLFMEHEKKRNNLSIGTVSLECKCMQSGNSRHSELKWNFRTIETKSKNWSGNFYFYSSIDIGKVNSHAIIYHENNTQSKQIEVEDLVRRNGVSLLCYPLGRNFIEKKSMDEFTIIQKNTDAFDFNRSEIIYVIPKNYGKKVNKIEIKIDLEEVPNIETVSAYFHEIGRADAKVGDRGIESKKVDFTENGKKEILFTLEGTEVNMDSVYYVQIKCTFKHVET